MIDFVDECIVYSEDYDISTYFLQMQTNQLFDIREPFRRYCNVLPAFRFKSAKW